MAVMVETDMILAENRERSPNWVTAFACHCEGMSAPVAIFGSFCRNDRFFRFFCEQPSCQPVEPVSAHHEKNIQRRNDQHIDDLGRYDTNDTLHAQPHRLQRGNVAGIEIGIVGFQNMCHGSGNRTETACKPDTGPHFALGGGVVQVKENDQQEFHHDNIVEGDGVEIQIALEIIADIPRTVNQIGVDHHQKEHGRGNGGSNGRHSPAVLAVVERHDRQHENKQRAEMEGQVVKVISVCQGIPLFSDLQQYDHTGQDLERDHADLPIFFADQAPQQHRESQHNNERGDQLQLVFLCPKFHNKPSKYEQTMNILPQEDLQSKTENVELCRNKVIVRAHAPAAI